MDVVQISHVHQTHVWNCLKVEHVATAYTLKYVVLFMVINQETLIVIGFHGGLIVF